MDYKTKFYEESLKAFSGKDLLIAQKLIQAREWEDLFLLIVSGQTLELKKKTPSPIRYYHLTNFRQLLEEYGQFFGDIDFNQEEKEETLDEEFIESEL